MAVSVLPATASLSTSLLLILATALVYYSVRLYNARMFFVRLRRRDMPMPPHSFFLGHLLYVKSVMDSLPKTAHKELSMGEISRRLFQKHGLYYMDFWPFSVPFLMVTSPAVALQVTQTNPRLALERPPTLRDWFRPITGGPSLFDMTEKEWKPWRAIFNKGFSADHLNSLVPNMVEESLIYCQTLRDHAETGDLFFLDPTTLRFTMDVIGRTVLNTRLGAQKGYNTLADSMLKQIQWQMPDAETNALEYFNLRRYVMQWWNGRQMDLYIGKELDKRYEEFQADDNNNRSKAVIDLVLQAYLTDKSKTSTKQLDPEFRLFATRQIRLFLFAGHDSMSSTICYIIHLLSTHPDALARLRAEHDSVFGSDLSRLPSLLAESPHLLQRLSYTDAVLKESMRLFPAASGIRYGAPGVDVVDEDGTRYPTENCMIWILHPTIQRNPDYWPRPDDFLPERWLVPSDHELYPAKNAYRPFEYGPRNCIGQGLVMTQLRAVTAMVAREFDFKPAYDEWDKLHPDSSGRPRTYRGDRAYQIEEGAAHPANHYPCRVFLRE